MEQVVAVIPVNKMQQFIFHSIEKLQIEMPRLVGLSDRDIVNIN